MRRLFGPNRGVASNDFFDKDKVFINMELTELKNIEYCSPNGSSKSRVLCHIMGPSGSGKGTLLHLSDQPNPVI